MNEIDINSLDLVNEPIEVDEGVTAEDFFAIPLPDDGDHPVRIRLGDRGIKAGRQDEGKGGKIFLSVHIVAEVVDKAGNRIATVFDNPNSVVMERDGKRYSRLHALLDAMGSPAPIRLLPGELLKHVQEVFAQPAEAIATTQWEASAKAQSQEDVDRAVAMKFAKAGKLKIGDYYPFLRGQKRFPLDEETGRYNPEVEDPISGETVRAQARVIRYKRAS